MSITKEARGHSADPEQEKLRDAKDAWNHEVSLLIAELIAFKRGINGRGDKNLGIPPSSIKDPLPNQVSSYLGTIVNQGGKVQEIARSIIDFQTHYSQVRKKKQTAASKEYPLIVEASWWGSRLWSYVSLLKRVEKEERKLRHRMISSLAEYHHDFLKVESKILARKDPDSVPDTLTLLINIFFDIQMNLLAPFIELDKIYQAKTVIQDKIPEETSNSNETVTINETAEVPAAITTETPADYSVDNILSISNMLMGSKPYLDIIINHMQNPENSKLNSDNKLFLKKQFQLFNKALSGINGFNHQLGTAKIDEDKLKIRYEILLRSYDHIKSILSQAFPNFNSITISNFSEVAEQIAKSLSTTAYIDFGLIKESDNFLSRWFNKSLLSFNPDNFDKTKLDLLQSFENIKHLSEDLSDSLEDSDTIFPMLKSKLSYLCQEILKASEIIRNLSRKYQNDIQRARKQKGEKFRDIREEDLRRLNEISNIFKAFVSK